MGDGRIAVLVCVVCAVVLSGCSGTTSGAPAPVTTTSVARSEPRSSSESSSQQPADRHGAPKVESPLEAGQYLAQPCSAVSPRLRESLKIPGEGVASTTGELGSRAPSCRWSNLATVTEGESVDVSFLKANKNGLADLYRQHDVFNDFKYWEETTVEGYPGVFHDLIERRSRGECSLAVGLNDALAMTVDETSSLGPRSCERVKSIAAAVIQTMKGQG